MTSLHDRFAAMADAAGPPSRLSADEVYTAARRRRRVQVALSVAGGLSALLVAGALVVLPELSAHGGATFGQVRPSATGDPGPFVYDGVVYQVVAADAQHLYALMNRCTTPTICTGDLVGTDDGGKTWTMRARDLIGPLAVHAPGVLTMDHRSESKGTGPQATEQISTSSDGGRTWTQVTTLLDTTQYRTCQPAAG